MFTQNPSNPADLQSTTEKVTVDNYFIIDWICSNPMRPGKGTPVIIAGNISPAELDLINAGKIRIEDPRYGTKHRAIVKVVQVSDIAEG